MKGIFYLVMKNTMYFQKTNGDVVFARTIFSTLGHIFDSSIIAYGLAYNRFKLKSHINSFILLPFLLLIASVAHGTYNTIASTSGAKSYLLMVPFMVFSMALLGGFLNNGMNNSPHFNKNLIASNDKSVNMIGTAFIMLYIIQQCIFIYISHNFDVTAARVLNTVGLVAILVIVMAYFLGTFDVVRGKWLNISEMIFKLRVNRNKALGLNCEIYTNNLSEVEHLTDYLVGHISDRVMVEGDDAIFLVKLKTPYSFNGIEYKSVLIRHINHRHKIISGVEFSVRFIVPVSKRVMLAKNNSRNSFEYAGDALLNVPKGLQQVDLNKITATTI
ncbi:MAG: PrsW family glutamic-type intramembrane protease [Bacteroidia bacterium]